MFRDEGDAARARADALELQAQGLKDELAAKDKLLQEKEAELRSRDQKLRALTQHQETPARQKLPPIFNEPPQRSFLSSELFLKIVFTSFLAVVILLLKTCVP